MMTTGASQEVRLVLIDTDAGIDDTIAIIMCIQAHKKQDLPFRIVGITCAGGNTEVDNVTQNVTRILETMKEPSIPIFRGAPIAMVTPFLYKGSGHKHHGSDGMGDAFPQIEPKLESEVAANAIIRLTHQYSGRLTILALGPLTNLALAVRLDPTIATLVKDLYIMGGNFQGAGNYTATAEFNFAYDPEAAYVTLETFKCPTFIAPLEMGRDKVVQSYDWRVNELGTRKSIECELINKIEAFALKDKYEPMNKWMSYDSTAAAALILPKIITKQVNHYCTVELHGAQTRGQMVVDYRPHLKEPENIFVITDMDSNLFRKMLEWAFGGPCPFN
jgi:inosine-uridine nucleoside N-ribohydrolase